MQSLLISYGKRILDWNTTFWSSLYDGSLIGGLFRLLKDFYRNSLTWRLFNNDLTGNSFTYNLLHSWSDSVSSHLHLPARWIARQREIAFGALGLLFIMTILAFIKLPYQEAGVLLAAALIAVATFYRTEYGLYSAALLLPFVPQKALLCLALLCLISMLWKMGQEAKPRFYLTPLFIPLLLLYLVMFYATVTSVLFWDSVGEFVIPIIGLLFLLVIVNTIDSREKLEALLLCLVIAGLITACLALYQYYTGVVAIETNKAWVDVRENPTVMNRAYAVFDNPNLLAQFMILISMLSIGVFFNAEKVGYRVLCGATAVIASFCLLLTYSRGGWISFAGALLILAAFKSKLLTSVFALAGVLLYSVLPMSITNRLATITSSKDTSNLYRLDTWSSTLEVIRAHWETGVGLGRKAFSRVFYTHMINSNTVPHSHNLYLQTISEFGILGLAVFCWLFIAVLRIGLKLSAAGKNWIRGVNAGLMGAFAGFFIHSTVDYFLWYYKLGIMLWLMVAIVIVLNKLDSNNRNVERNEQAANAG